MGYDFNASFWRRAAQANAEHWTGNPHASRSDVIAAIDRSKVRVPTLSPAFIQDSIEMRRRRLEEQARGTYGRQDTILTGPLGIVEEPVATRKTILGA